MLKKITYTLSALAVAAILGRAGVTFHTQPPERHTGANGEYCTECHSSYDLNSGGGSVSVSGLPVGGYTAGTAYNFSIKIAHDSADRKRWGFAIEARNSANQSIGAFSTTNPHAALNPDSTELSHYDAELFQTPDSTYTYSNLTWTAPANPGPADNQVTFYYVGNAANGNSRPTLDYIYSGHTMVTLPISLQNFKANVMGTSVTLNWKTQSENNSDYFIIEKSADNQHFIQVATVNAAGTSNAARNYSFTDDKPAFYERATFYRLVLVDKDGTKKYSDLVNVTIKAPASFVKKLYPNPVKAGGVMQIEMISDRNQTVNVQLFNISGRKIKDIQTLVVKGNNIIDMPINKFTANGMYALTVRTESQIQQIPLLIH